MRRVIFDTETTGLTNQDKIIEICCLETINNIVTGKKFKKLINPNGREISPEAYKIHKISQDQLNNKPIFSEVYQCLIDFIGNSPLIIHNAQFDMRMLNQELKAINKPSIENEIIDTLVMARKQFPGSRASLDALCIRFGIDISARKNQHSAEVDCILLAKVFDKIQPHKDSNFLHLLSSNKINKRLEYNVSDFNVTKTIMPSPQELETHNTLMASLEALSKK